MKYLSIWMVIVGMLIVAGMEAEAVDLRRPYAAAHAVSYGYDNDGGSSGCTDYNCGSICYNGHTGNDFPLSLGTQVLAGADGVISAVNNSCANYGGLGNTCGGRCGNYVQIRHSDGDLTIYCHMRRDHMAVSNGQTVKCGDVLGQSASSGSSTGPHLHLGWRPGGGASTDVYAGSCTSSPGAWRNQNGYGQSPGAACGCVPSTEVCDGTDNNCDGVVDGGDVCEIDLLHEEPAAYARTLSTDVTGDGLQDICARFYSGVRCFGPTGDGWSETISSTLMAEENGWGAAHYYSTIRMGDIDGDGRADICARHSQGFSCWLSTGDGFEEFDRINWSNDGNWNNPQYYTTIRLADINGDGRQDACARGASGWRCHLSTPDGFGPAIHGPEWSNAGGFDRPRYYGTIRVGDLDGDGKDDVCMRGPNGFECHRSTGDGFEPLVTESTMTDANGWGRIIYWPSIRLADIDGDGRASLCARNSSHLFCQRFDGEEFGERLHLGGLSNDSGWSDASNYRTLRVGDMTGDGSDDLCIRANARVLCYRVDGDEVTRWDGPEWSDGGGWDEAASYAPIFMTNIDFEQRGAVCGRSQSGLACQQYADGGFEAFPTFAHFTNDGGWTARKYYSTIRMGQGDCRSDWCEEEEEVVEEEEDISDDLPDSGVDAGGFGNDVGISSDVGESNGEFMDSASTSSCGGCSAAPSGGGQAGWLILVALGLLWRRRRNFSLGTAAFLIVIGPGLLGCERGPNEELASAEETSASEEALEPTAVEPAPAGKFADHEVLAISGDWRVVAEIVDAPERSDGPLRYRPILLKDDEPQSWPLAAAMISEARLAGQGPTLFALDINGTLERRSLAADEQDVESIVVARGVTSQVAAAIDGCCIAYIREHAEGQSLEVFELTGGAHSSMELGYSLGWAPAVSPEGNQVAWTASPQGHASILIADIDSDEPRAISNGEKVESSDDLDPFPVGIHAPVWIEEGIAFEGQESTLWLIDEEGNYLGSADASRGMFWDEARAELVDREGAVIRWR